MSKQKESLWVADPMNRFFSGMGWWVQNITPGFIIENGKRYSPLKGLPDAYIGKKGYKDRWVEYKVIRNNSITPEDSQLEKFEKMHKAGIPIYIICSAVPLENNYRERLRLYNKIINEEPNVIWFLSGRYKMLF